MGFSTPAMEATARGPVCDAHCTTVSTLLSRHLTVCDWALSAMPIDHATVDMFSDSTPDLANFISTSLCSTKDCKRTSAISKYEFVKQPWGL